MPEKKLKNQGQVTQIIGPVVDIEFTEGDLPQIK